MDVGTTGAGGGGCCSSHVGEAKSSIEDKIVPRTPTFCPGCPHRDSSAALLEIRENFQDPQYMLRHHGQGPVDLVAHGDTGCYTMLMFAPTEQLMHNYSGMGLGGGTGQRASTRSSRTSKSFSWATARFSTAARSRSAMPSKPGRIMTFIILKNDTTAMTGHQEHAGTEVDRARQPQLDPGHRADRPRHGRHEPADRRRSSRPEDRSMYKRVLENARFSPTA